jgi:hypothetical protein
MSTTADRSTGAMRPQSVASLTHKEVGFVKHSHPWRVSGALKNYKEQPI